MIKVQVGDKVVPRDLTECGALTKVADRIAYLTVDRVKNDGEMRDYTAFDRNGERIGSCYNCYETKDLTPYNQTKENTQVNKQYKTGEIINLGNVVTALPAETRSGAQAGEQYVVLDAAEYGSDMKKGTVVTLSHNDNSRCPSFSYDEDGSTRYMRWNHLGELPTGVDLATGKPAKPAVMEAITRYDDNVEVTETTVKHDGTTYTRDELQAKIAKYKELLARPYAYVPVIAVAKKKTPAKKPAAKTAVAA